MLRVSRLVLACGTILATSLAYMAPANASMSHVAHGIRPEACTGPVFGSVKLQNVASNNYLAESTSSDFAVLYTGTNQTWDGYRDGAGHLIIYRCGTSDALTDDVGANCINPFADCVTVTPYNDGEDQWWTRDENSSGTIWELQTLDGNGGSKAIDDPGDSKSDSQRVVMYPQSLSDTAEQFVHD